MSVCLSVCLFRFGAQTTGWIPTKFGMDLPLALWVTSKYFFGLTPPEGGKILEKLKNPNFPLMALDRGQNPFAAPFEAPFAHFLEEGKRDI